MTKEKIIDSFLRAIPSIVILIFGVIGFYFTTKSTVASNTERIKSNKTEVRAVKLQLDTHEKADMSKADFIEMKGDLIRELTNTQQQLKATNERLDKVIFNH